MRAKSGRLPPLSRESLALKLRKNWDDRHPTDVACMTSGLDDSLTSLNWLQNLNIMKIAAPQPGASPPIVGQPRHPDNNDPDDGAGVQFSSNDQVDPNAVLNMANLSGGVRVKQEPGLVQFRTLAGLDVGSSSNIDSLESVDYKTNGHIKPPYSYATLICMAMRDSQKKKITLAGIYNWITENFMYYRMADPSWQNSIRHNLSLNKCFQKVPRRKDEPGKGGFWRINPEYEDMFVNGVFKKRRCSPILPTTPVRGEPTSASTPVGDLPTATLPPLKKIKRENEDSNSSMSSLSGLAMAGAMTPLLTPMNSVDETENAVRSIEIKREPNLNSSAVYVKTGVGNDVEDDANDSIDISWSTILNQDIDVAGVKVKTEDIIDTPDGAASPITALSPPASDTDKSEISLEDFLKADFSKDMDNPLDLTNGSTLDLTISGIGLKAPEWWEESLNGSKQLFGSPSGHSRMSTPVATIDDSDFAHPWAEDKSNSDGAADSFDGEFSSLLQLMDNMPSPKMPTES